MSGLTNINAFRVSRGNQSFLMVCRPKLLPTALASTVGFGFGFFKKKFLACLGNPK